MKKSRMLVAMTLLSAAVAPLAAQEDRRPTVAVLDFNNSAIGPNRADYEALGKGISDFLITELAGNAQIRVVERDKLQALIKEQDLGRDGRMTAESAARVGKLLGAQHMIMGGFIVDPKGNLRLNARAVNSETGQIVHTDVVADKADNFIDAIGNLATKMNRGMKLPEMRRMASNAPTGSDRASATPAVQKDREPATATQVAAAPAQQKVPYAAVLLYSKALEQKDRGNTREAVVLFRQSLEKFPEFSKAKTELAKIETRPGN